MINDMPTDFNLLETILFVPDQGFYLLDHHLTRLQNAIRDFRKANSALFPNAPSDQLITNLLNDNVPLNGSYQRVRLLVDTASKVVIEHTPLPNPVTSFESLDQAADSQPCVSLVLDTEPFDLATDDPFILHKTTQRAMYDLSRKRTNCDWHATLNEPFDVVLWNQNKQITETSITNIAIRFNTNDNQHAWKTPPVKCGLLPGVFRSYLLANQQENNLIEDNITIEDLKKAQKDGCPIVCFNSVRKAYRVQLLAV